MLHLFEVVVYYTFLLELLHNNAAAQKLCGRVAVPKILRNVTCGRFFAMLEVTRLKSNRNVLHQGDLLKMFLKNNLARVSFLELLTK